MRNAVTNKIRLLKNITPNPDWLKNQRSILLLGISESGKKSRFSYLPIGKTWKVLPGFLFSSLVLKPVLVFGTILCLIFGGGFLTAQAAKTALPGDLLYPIKLIIENVKVKISSQSAKSKLQAEFVCNRAEELSQIVGDNNNPLEKKEMVVKMVDKLQAQVVNVKSGLDKIKQIEPNQMAAAAEAISQKTLESEKILIEAKQKLAGGPEGEESKEMVKAIDAAVKDVREASVLAAELKGGKTGIEVQMEVKETEKPAVENLPGIPNEASTSFEEINK